MLFPGFSARGADFQTTQVRRTQENSPVRQHWEPRVGNGSPGTGRKNPLTRIFRPVPGLTDCQRGPTAVCRGLVSFALRALLPNTLFAACRSVGQPIQAADPLSNGSSRLKAGHQFLRETGY